MTTDPTRSSSPAADALGTSGVNGQKNQLLGKDAFMQLLITKMQHQDPTKPEDDSQMLAQLAQFSTLEQMQQMNSTLTSIAGFFADAKAAVATPPSTTAPETTNK